jgi:carboxymethylenebutenolidase
MGTNVEFKRPDGQTVRGYLAEPASAKGAPGVVVLQEWWGVNAQIKGVADRFADAGYLALVPDLYRGKSTVEAAEAEHLMTNLNFGDAAGQDVRGAVQFLKSRCAKVGVTGFCMGGALTLLAAVNVPEADAAVVWYGFPPLEYIDASKIKIPLLGHYATRDVPFPIATVDQLEAKLRDAKVNFEFHRYDAMHAFANETQVGANRLPITEYQPEAAATAWERTLDFFGKHLR